MKSRIYGSNFPLVSPSFLCVTWYMRMLAFVYKPASFVWTFLTAPACTQHMCMHSTAHVHAQHSTCACTQHIRDTCHPYNVWSHLRFLHPDLFNVKNLTNSRRIDNYLTIRIIIPAAVLCGLTGGWVQNLKASYLPYFLQCAMVGSAIG